METTKESWWVWLIELLAEAFLGWQRELGATEERARIKEKVDDLHEKFDEIGTRPIDGRTALERMRERNARTHPKASKP